MFMRKPFLLHAPSSPQNKLRETSGNVAAYIFGIMRNIIRIQSALGMCFRRVVCFTPCQGPLERANSVLKQELQQLEYAFGPSRILDSQDLVREIKITGTFGTLGSAFLPPLSTSLRAVWKNPSHCHAGTSLLPLNSSSYTVLKPWPRQPCTRTQRSSSFPQQARI